MTPGHAEIRWCCDKIVTSRVIPPMLSLAPAPPWAEVRNPRREPSIGSREECLAERGERLLDGLMKGWNLGLDHVPENVFIEAEIARS